MNIHAPITDGRARQVRAVVSLTGVEFETEPYVTHGLGYIDPYGHRWYSPIDGATLMLSDGDSFIVLLNNGSGYISSLDGVRRYMIQEGQTPMVDLR